MNPLLSSYCLWWEFMEFMLVIRYYYEKKPVNICFLLNITFVLKHVIQKHKRNISMNLSITRHILPVINILNWHLLQKVIFFPVCTFRIFANHSQRFHGFKIKNNPLLGNFFRTLKLLLILINDLLIIWIFYNHPRRNSIRWWDLVCAIYLWCYQLHFFCYLKKLKSW